MELIKKQVHMNKYNCIKNIRVTLDNDFNVPDVNADVMSIIKAKGEAEMKEVRFVSGKGLLKGKLSFCILYVGDEEDRPICQLKGSVPFEETVSLDDMCSDEDVSVKCLIDDLRSEMINSRKVGMKAVITLEVFSETIVDGEGSVAVEGAESEGVLTQKKILSVTQLALCKKDIFRFRDEFTLPSTKDSVERMLYESVSLEEMETRLVENRINIGGQAKIFLLYITSGEAPHLEYYETTVPIRGVVDCDGCDESMVPHIEIGMHNKDLEIKEDGDGEARVADLEMVLDLFIKVYREEEMEVLTDFYSQEKKLTPVFKDSYFEHLLLKNNSKAKVVEKIDIEQGQKVNQIWNVEGEFRIDSKTIVDDGILVEGVVEANILYSSGDETMPLGSLKGSIPFEQKVDVKGISSNSVFSLTGTVDQINGVILGEKELEVKAVVALNVIAFEIITLPMIADYTEEELDLQEISKEPGLVGYVVKKGDCLWNIAKKFRTKIENVMELNEMESEELNEGQILLLMKEPKSI